MKLFMNNWFYGIILVLLSKNYIFLSYEVIIIIVLCVLIIVNLIVINKYFFEEIENNQRINKDIINYNLDKKNELLETLKNLNIFEFLIFYDLIDKINNMITIIVVEYILNFKMDIENKEFIKKIFEICNIKNYSIKDLLEGYSKYNNK